MSGNFWDGYITFEDIAGYAIHWIATLADPVLFRYAKVDIDWRPNPAGYFAPGAVVVCPGVSSRYNISYGVQIGQRDESTCSCGEVPFVEQASISSIAADGGKLTE